MVTLFVTVLCISLFALLCNAFALPGACSGVCGNAHDPALIRRSDGTYFRFSTNGKVAIHTAPDITGPWTYRGAAIPAGSKINKAGRNDLWVGQTMYHIKLIRKRKV
jgi:arabinan endo-1,5-alpha-L-arabinosidase